MSEHSEAENSVRSIFGNTP